jgi:hypothetical protein
LSVYASPNNYRILLVPTDLEEISVVLRLRESGNGMHDLFGVDLTRVGKDREVFVRQLLSIPRYKLELATKPRRKTRNLREKWGEWVDTIKCERIGYKWSLKKEDEAYPTDIGLV